MAPLQTYSNENSGDGFAIKKTPLLVNDEDFIIRSVLDSPKLALIVLGYDKLENVT